MATTMEACYLLPPPLSYRRLAARFPATCSPCILTVSCKNRPRRLSSQQRRQQPKKVSNEDSPPITKYEPLGDESRQVQNANSDSVLNSPHEALPGTIPLTITDETHSSFGEETEVLPCAGTNTIPLTNTDETQSSFGEETVLEVLSCAGTNTIPLTVTDETRSSFGEETVLEDLPCAGIDTIPLTITDETHSSFGEETVLEDLPCAGTDTIPLTITDETHSSFGEETGLEDLPCAGTDTIPLTIMDETHSSFGEETVLIENNDAGQKFSSVRLEDLIDMIQNAEKNILLLNEARVRTLEDLDKILSEKDALQAEMNNLKITLAETDERIRVADQDKINMELLEEQLEIMKKERSLGNTSKGASHNSYGDYGISLDATDPLDEEFAALRKENELLKDDIQSLKIQIDDVKKTEERVIMLEKERSVLEAAIRELESKLVAAQQDSSEPAAVKAECETLRAKVENLQGLLDNATKQAEQAETFLQLNQELQNKVEKLEASLEEAKASNLSADKSQQLNEFLKQKTQELEERLQISDQEISSHVQLYEESVKEFQDTLGKLKEEGKRKALSESVVDMPWDFWSSLFLTIDGWLLEKKLSSFDAKLLREMAWKKDVRIRDAYLTSKSKSEHETIATFLKLTLSGTSPGLHIIHIAAEMAPAAKVGGLGDVVSGLSKALQRKGHLVEIVLPKYDCMQYDCISDMKALDVVVESYFDGQLFKNKVWTGTVEGVPVFFIEPNHPSRFFWRGQLYGEHDDFKRFSFFSRAALELLYQAGKKPDIIHCHDWQTAFIAPLYWDVYASRGFNSARICFTCHNFEYQGTAPASELASCGLDVHQLNRPDRLQDTSWHDKVNPVKGGIVFSNIVTTVSPTYAQEVRTIEGGHGLHGILNIHSRKFVGILNGIDTEIWNPSTDAFLKAQYNAEDLQGKAENKSFMRKHLELSSADAMQPLVCCITRLVPQKGVHLIRHALYRTLELGGQFVLLGSSPVPHIQREFEDIANNFRSHPHARLLLKYDDSLSHSLYAASDMIIIPSIFEPCGLTQMIAMRYGSIPIVRKTGGLNDTVFDLDDNTVPVQYRNGFTFLAADEQDLSNALKRAFSYYTRNPEIWQQLVQKDMTMDFSWASSAVQYEELYHKSVARARAAAQAV